MKIRSGFVSNSSSSSFVIASPRVENQRSLPVGNPYEAWEWLKSISKLPRHLGLTLFLNGDEVDLRFEPDADCYKNDKVVQYGGCCEYCYGPFREWTEGEFIEDFKHDSFVLQSTKSE